MQIIAEMAIRANTPPELSPPYVNPYYVIAYGQFARNDTGAHQIL